MKFDDDALDRALFALPLEEPPMDLRASILRATIYAPAPVFKTWELAVLGAVAAVMVWFVAMIAMGGATLFLDTVQMIGAIVMNAIAKNGSTIAWVAAGGAAAIWLSIFTGFQPAVEGAKKHSR
jgi:hypothetical protein